MKILTKEKRLKSQEFNTENSLIPKLSLDGNRFLFQGNVDVNPNDQITSLKISDFTLLLAVKLLQQFLEELPFVAPFDSNKWLSHPGELTFRSTPYDLYRLLKF